MNKATKKLDGTLRNWRAWCADMGIDLDKIEDMDAESTEKVIKQVDKIEATKEGNMKYVIIDIDKICFDDTERLARCQTNAGTIDWERAFSNEEVCQDPAIEGAAASATKVSDKYGIMYLTGRNTKCRKATLEALSQHDFPLPFGIRVEMRERGDIRPDDVVKKESIVWLKLLPVNRKVKYYDFLAAIDDDWSGKLKPMYESLGIPCFTSFNDFFNSEVWDATAS